ncbi:deoxyribonuclease IV [Cohnella thailandensis]|uniref:Deoxyribonuclease IV n=1 Tax=Cohnella thailandensis TaxID=557557 RepID=A0A841T5W9_9BACL|nr:deoxyribonuclease IV [Cohnella thailandensis]MBB6638349.1 deoxyribonuclease IV [Cohnella thailandensis]MBP1977173.1 deoxyribonuclease-4 [Cohnella thailandensis]
MIIGCHLSTRRGYRETARTAVKLGGNAYQYFPKNPRSLQLKSTFDRAEAQRCAAWCRENGVVSVAHGPYPVNPAADAEAAETMAACTLNDLEIAEACGSLGVVVHFGVYRASDPLQGYRNVIQYINIVLSRWKGKALILLENQAGDHGPMGTTLDELATVRSLCDKPEGVGFCLDTCHLFASGQWDGANWERLRERGLELGFWNSLKAVHLNDSRYPSGSKKDRHARIGDGHIGEEGFRELLASDVLEGIPKILETPAGPDGTHAEEMALVKRLSHSEEENE